MTSVNQNGRTGGSLSKLEAVDLRSVWGTHERASDSSGFAPNESPESPEYQGGRTALGPE
jgi:hypothetical protein